jgi:hypothetical protein
VLSGNVRADLPLPPSSPLPIDAPGEVLDNFPVKITEFQFPIEIGSVCDIDFMPNGRALSIQGSESHHVVIWGDQRLALPETWSAPEFPFIRYLPDGRAFIVDSGFFASRRKNAWIMNSQGRIDAHFEIGSAAVEVAALWGLIAVAYHPISAKAHGHQIQPLQRTGIAFFDLNGRMIMGFNQEAAKYGVSVENIRCMTALSRSQLLFVPERLTIHGKEVENPIVHFDCATKRPKVFSAPHPRSEAITMGEGLIQLASPEGWEDQIITFDVETKISQHRGEFLGIFRGLENGAFLAQLSSADYAVVKPGVPEKAFEVRSVPAPEEQHPSID